MLLSSQAKQLEKELRNGSDAEAEQRFVWGKKIEKQIQDGKGIDDLGPEAERRRREERLVSLVKRMTLLWTCSTGCAMFASLTAVQIAWGLCRWRLRR